jgi:hypothetical protein
MSVRPTADAERLEREIEAIMRARTGRESMVVPSGRFALLMALCAWLGTETGVLMSPLTDDVIFFIVLAAGLRPVMAPLSPRDGNIDVAAVPPATWASVGAVVTTNLFGLPDRLVELRAICSSRGIPLIEDAAHAIESEVGGRPVGTFGEASAFSLAKHAGARAGGVLTFADASRRPELERLRDQLLVIRSSSRRLADVAKPQAKRALTATGLEWPVRRARTSLGLLERSGQGYRMALRPELLREAIAAGRGHFDLFEPWTRLDRADHRMRLTVPQLRDALGRLLALPAHRARRLAGVEALAELPSVAPGVLDLGRATPLYRVPLLVEGRDRLVNELFRRNLGVYYTYDPPLDDYAGPEFATPSPDTRAARWFGRSMLPIDPLDATRLLRELPSLPERLRPAVFQLGAGGSAA